MKLGKESIARLSPLARHVETMGVIKEQKRVLEHNEGPKKAKGKKK